MRSMEGVPRRLSLGRGGLVCLQKRGSLKSHTPCITTPDNFLQKLSSPPWEGGEIVLMLVVLLTISSLKFSSNCF